MNPSIFLTANISGVCLLVVKGECGSGLTLGIVSSRRMLGVARRPTKFEGQNVFSVKKGECLKTASQKLK